MATYPLPNPASSPVPKNPRKAVKRETENAQPAETTRPEVLIEFCSGSSYGNFNAGWAPLPRRMSADRAALSDNGSFIPLHEYCYQLYMRSRKGGEIPAHEGEISKKKAAAFCCVDVHTINNTLRYIKDRGLAIVKHLAGTKALIRWIYEPETINGKRYLGWTEIAKTPYKTWKAEWNAAHPIAEADNPAEETADESVPLEVKEGTIRLTKAPIQVSAGQKSRPIKVNTGVRTLRIHWESKVLDLRFEAVVTSGELVLTGNVPDESFAKSTQDANREESTRSRESSGHGCPNGRKIPPNAGSHRYPQKGETTTTTVEAHPRSEELAKVFDPLIYAHCKQTLSGDPRFHAQACEAIGDTPHDDLVKAAIERGARMLRPGHIPQVCKEIRYNWEAGKIMPAKASKKAAVPDPKTIVPYDPLGLRKKHENLNG